METAQNMGSVRESLRSRSFDVVEFVRWRISGMRARGGAPFGLFMFLCALAGCGIGGRAVAGGRAASAGARRSARITKLRGGQDGKEWTWNAEVDMRVHNRILCTYMLTL